MRYITFVFLISTLVLSIETYAQKKEKSEVYKVVEDLFEGYRQGDSSMVSKTFMKGAVMQRVSSYEGKTTVSDPASVQSWLNYIGKGLDKVHDEQIWDPVISIDGDLATVWVKYALYLGKDFSHCGVDSFSLVKIDNEWKIFHIVDTRKNSSCEIPDEISKLHR